MVLIPSDVGIRMRMQTEAALQPVAPATEIPADLPELRPGQAFAARIQEVLPENTYKAIVAGRSLTLALPEGAQAGDTLELVVVDRTAHLIVARLASQAAATGETPADGQSPFTRLSQTGQLISALLPRDGSPPPPVALTRGEPLVPAAADPRQLAAELAPRLEKAVGQSGLFYESHQVQWAMGQRPLADLLVEPQARHSPVDTEGPRSPPGASSHGASTAARGPTAGSLAVLLQSLFGGEPAPGQANPAQASAAAAQAMPTELQPLVQQQLDTAATQRMAWHGEVWPGQTLEWRIEPDERRSSGSESDGPRAWATSLHLVTPRLGDLDARLDLGGDGVRVSISAADPEAAADLRREAPRLADSLAAAGVPLLAIRIRHANEK